MPAQHAPKTWSVYALLCDMGNEEVLIKVGVTQNPGRRYNTLLTGLAFPSIMAYVPVGPRGAAYAMENELHSALKEFHTEREWFRMTRADKVKFNDEFSSIYSTMCGRNVEWRYVGKDKKKRVYSREDFRIQLSA